MAYFIHRWDKKTFLESSEGEKLKNLLSNMFTEGLVNPEDVVFPVAIFDRTFYVVGRVVAKEFEEGPTRFAGKEDWSSGGIVYGTKPHGVIRMDAVLPDDAARRLELIGADGTAHYPKINKRGELEQQSFRGVREITAASARMLEAALA